MEWQGYVNSELHKSYSVLFDGTLDSSVKAKYAASLRKKYEWLDAELGGKSYLTGASFTAADAYLYNVTRWARYVKLDLTGLAAVHAFMLRTAERPAVREAAKAESIPI
jgi:glutathione S-transferase